MRSNERTSKRISGVGWSRNATTGLYFNRSVFRNRRPEIHPSSGTNCKGRKNIESIYASRGWAGVGPSIDTNLVAPPITRYTSLLSRVYLLTLSRRELEIKSYGSIFSTVVQLYGQFSTHFSYRFPREKNQTPRTRNENVTKIWVKVPYV